MKIFLNYLVFIVVVLSPLTLSAQAVDNNGLERNINKEGYVRFNYGNDFFTATDYYLTQTIFLELVHPGLRRFPLMQLLVQPAKYEMKYGLATEHNAYTPTDYVSSQILYGDRPFAATLSLKTFVIATDTDRKQRISSSLSTGIIGPGAGGGEMQTYIHEHTPNAIPHGWHNQIANDVVLNYQVAYEKQLLALSDYMNIAASGMARVGTLSDKANIGLTLMAGVLNNPFQSINIKGRRLQLYVYDHPEVNAVAYDATLQGGAFNRNSAYTIAGADVTRVVFRNNWGVVLQWHKLYLEYYQSYMTKEFRTGMDMHNGGIQIGVGF